MEKKKPSFKAPAFSVPSKVGTDKTAATKNVKKEIKKDTEIKKDKPSESKKDKTKDEQKGLVKALGSKVQAKEKKLKSVTKAVSAGDGSASAVKDGSGDAKVSTECNDNKDNIENKENIEQNVMPDCTGDNVKDENEKQTEGAKDDKNEVKEKEVNETKTLSEDTNINEKPHKKEKVKTNLGKRKQEDSKDGKKEKAAEKKAALPVRSLTDAEYEEIFTATIDNAWNLDLDKWEPKCTSPRKVPKPKEKKYKRTVGKPKPPSQPSSQPSSQEQKKVCEKRKIDKEEAVIKDKENTDKTETKEADSQPDHEMKEPDSEDREESDQDEGVAEAMQVEDEGVGEAETSQDAEKTEAQVENESTPVDSGDETTKNTVPMSPPHKKMKPNKPVKKTKLVPKHLPFERKENKKSAEKKKVEMKEKIRKTQQFEKEKIKSPDISKISSKKSGRRKEMISRNVEVKGTWVQCCRMECKKWRYMPNVSEPSKIPEYWTCSMNTREKYNSCEKAEEAYDESDHIYTKYCEGSIVMAKMPGYPWWPAMVEVDPDYDVFCWVHENNSMLPTHYHVVFLDEKVSRTWVRAAQVLPFDGDEERIIVQDKLKSKKKGPSYERELNIAKKNALEALDYPIQDRIKMFGFATKFKGQWSTEDLRVTNVVLKDKTNQQKRKKQEVKDETIDECTMVDVLDNTEALLSNVEEMLESLDSELYDSNEDSDFSVSDLVVVEGKKKETRQKDRKVRMTKPEIYSDSSDDEMEVAEKEDETVENDDGKKQNEASPAENHAEIKGTGVTFDKDIFTMELDHEENDTDSIVKIIDELESSSQDLAEKGTVKAENEDIKEDKIDESSVKAETEEKNKENGDEDTEKENLPDCSKKDEKSEQEVEGKGKSGKSDEIQKGKKSSGSKKETNKEKKAGSKPSGFKKPAVKGSKKKDKAQKETDKTEITDEPKTGDDGAMKVEENKTETEKDESLPENKDDVTSNENQIKKESASKIKSPLNSENKDLKAEKKDNSKAEPKEAKPNTNTESKEAKQNDNANAVPKEPIHNEGIGLEDEEDDEFDLGDQTMYESDTGADKIAERADIIESNNVVNVNVEMDEDSDPFDMMEE